MAFLSSVAAPAPTMGLLLVGPLSEWRVSQTKAFAQLSLQWAPLVVAQRELRVLSPFVEPRTWHSDLSVLAGCLQTSRFFFFLSQISEK